MAGNINQNGQTGNGLLLINNATSGFIFPRYVYVANGGVWNKTKSIWVNKSGVWTQTFPQPYQNTAQQAGYPGLSLTSGSGTITVPQGYNYVDIIIGGGGGGGGSSTAGNGGGGGGAGAFWFGTNTVVNAGDQFKYTIGAAGIGATASTGNAGNNGGDTYLYAADGTTVLVKAPGGQGGAGSAQPPGNGVNPGGSGGGGDVNGNYAGGTAGSSTNPGISGGTLYVSNGGNGDGTLSGMGGGSGGAGGSGSSGGSGVSYYTGINRLYYYGLSSNMSYPGLPNPSSTYICFSNAGGAGTYIVSNSIYASNGNLGGSWCNDGMVTGGGPYSSLTYYYLGGYNNGFHGAVAGSGGGGGSGSGGTRFNGTTNVTVYPGWGTNGGAGYISLYFHN